MGIFLPGSSTIFTLNFLSQEVAGHFDNIYPYLSHLRNVMLDKYGRAKVANFGLAKLLPIRDEKEQLWLAPECKDFKRELTLR